MEIINFCAAIVLYNPEYEKLKRNIQSISKQVEKIYIFDNGSVYDKKIEILLDNNRIKFIRNKNNIGIAAALNMLIKVAYNDGYKWVLALDQDSIASSNMINEYRRYVTVKNLAIITPTIIDANKKNIKENKNFIEEYTEILNAEEIISSGSLLNIDIFFKMSGFNEKLFIDFVDTEYQKRILDGGYKIIRVNKVILHHELGKIKLFKFFKIQIICTNHSANRRYYMVRNRLYFKKKYFSNKEFFKEKVRLILGTAKIVIFEKEKIKKINYTIKGFKDYKKLL